MSCEAHFYSAPDSPEPPALLIFLSYTTYSAWNFLYHAPSALHRIAVISSIPTSQNISGDLFLPLSKICFGRHLLLYTWWPICHTCRSFLSLFFLCSWLKWKSTYHTLPLSKSYSFVLHFMLVLGYFSSSLSHLPGVSFLSSSASFKVPLCSLQLSIMETFVVC